MNIVQNKLIPDTILEHAVQQTAEDLKNMDIEDGGDRSDDGKNPDGKRFLDHRSHNWYNNYNYYRTDAPVKMDAKYFHHPTPPGLKTKLLPHQQTNLAAMLDIEKHRSVCSEFIDKNRGTFAPTN